MMALIKPCPKCGGPARVVKHGIHTDRWHVRCDATSCNYTFETPDEAIEDWNRRYYEKQITDLQPEKDRLKEFARAVIATHRGWPIDGEGWVEGDLLRRPNELPGGGYFIQWWDGDGKFHRVEVHPDSVSQATGLPDKNRKMIFGGAEFRSDLWGTVHVVRHGLRTAACLIGRPTGGEWPPQYLDCFHSDDIEIIGSEWERKMEAKK